MIRCFCDLRFTGTVLGQEFDVKGARFSTRWFPLPSCLHRFDSQCFHFFWSVVCCFFQSPAVWCVVPFWPSLLIHDCALKCLVVVLWFGLTFDSRCQLHVVGLVCAAVFVWVPMLLRWPVRYLSFSALGISTPIAAAHVLTALGNKELSTFVPLPGAFVTPALS